MRVLFPKMVDAWLATLREVADRGIHVIAESIIVPDNRARYDHLFGDLRTLLVGVRCPLEVVHLREAERPPRINGPYDVTAEEVDLVHQHAYPIEVDTSTEATADSVARILDAWRGLNLPEAPRLE